MAALPKYRGCFHALLKLSGPDSCVTHAPDGIYFEEEEGMLEMRVPIDDARESRQ